MAAPAAARARPIVAAFHCVPDAAALVQAGSATMGVTSAAPVLFLALAPVAVALDNGARQSSNGLGAGRRGGAVWQTAA